MWKGVPRTVSDSGRIDQRTERMQEQTTAVDARKKDLEGGSVDPGRTGIYIVQQGKSGAIVRASGDEVWDKKHDGNPQSELQRMELDIPRSCIDRSVVGPIDA